MRAANAIPAPRPNMAPAPAMPAPVPCPPEGVDVLAVLTAALRPDTHNLAAEIRHERELRLQAERFREDALRLQATEISRRLDVLNHAHEEARTIQAKYVDGDLWRQKMEEIESRLAKKDLEAQAAVRELAAVAQTAKDIRDEANKKAQDLEKDNQRKSEEQDRRASRRLAIAGTVMGAVMGLMKFVPANFGLSQRPGAPTPVVVSEEPAAIPFKDAAVIKEK